MSKYVDIEKVQHLIVETGNKHSRNGEDIYTCGSVCADLVISVYELPTADVQEVHHGQWVDGKRMRFDGTFHWFRQCSECLYEREDDNSEKDTNYCPNCGALMQGE